MKRLLLLIVFVASFFCIKAQYNEEIIYLKNGSYIRGIVIEQVPNEYLSVQTRDGQVYSFYIDEISKIMKYQSQYNTYSTIPKTGYKGFIDLAYTFGTGDYGLDRLELSTSHGYQFNPYLYAGIGVGLNYYVTPELLSVPIFFNPRLTIPTGSLVSPFVDLKIGYTVSSDIKGFYLSPSVGARFSVAENKAINLSLGYSLQSIEFIPYTYYTNSLRKGSGGITLKVGFEY